MASPAAVTGRTLGIPKFELADSRKLAQDALVWGYTTK
jgi:hypothetical protein